jgi:hypothetical protein
MLRGQAVPAPFSRGFALELDAALAFGLLRSAFAFIQAALSVARSDPNQQATKGLNTGSLT